MTDVRETLADHARNVLLVLGAALVLLGAVGPGPAGPVAVLGVVILLAAFLLDEAVEALLRRDEDTEQSVDDPVSDLRERYVRGELDREEFERHLERVLDDDPEVGRDPTSADGHRDAEVLTETTGPSGSSERS
jgi:chromatin segregation and condensation protein Rec8/ScpA/Scc1 (kleisin family)